MLFILPEILFVTKYILISSPTFVIIHIIQMYL